MKVSSLNKKARVGIALGAAGAASMVGLLAVPATFGGFTDTTKNAGNSVAAGTLTASNSKPGTYVFSVSNKKPGDSDSDTVTITNTGSLPATEQLVVDNASGALDDLLQVKIHDDDANKWIVGGASTYVTLNAVPTTAFALDGTAGVGSQWAHNEAHTFTVYWNIPNGTPAHDNPYQGTSASFDLTFNGAQ